MLTEVNIFLPVENATVIKADLVVAAYNDFVFEGGEFVQKCEKLDKVLLLSVVCEISSVDEDVTLHRGCYLIELVVLSMGVRDYYYL
jgi:hypothetical protein